MVPRAEIKQQATEAASRLKTRGEDTRILRGEVAVLIISLFSHNSSPLYGHNEQQFIEEKKDNFISFLAGVLVLALSTDSPQANILILDDFSRE